jgi:hypothetical protein
MSSGVSANARWKRLWWLAAMLVAAGLALVLVVCFKGSTRSGPGGVVEAARGEGSPAGSGPWSDHAPGSALAGGQGAAVAAAGSPEDEPPAMGENEYLVDMERLRSQIPDNLYWRLGEPTMDPQTLKARAEEEQRWNALFGKIQSSTASEDEVHRYYEHRRQLSDDYIEFASLVLETYGDRLPERDRGMYELSITLHTARLTEIPRLVDDALARRSAHEQRKKEWLESQRTTPEPAR